MKSKQYRSSHFVQAKASRCCSFLDEPKIADGRDDVTAAWCAANVHFACYMLHFCKLPWNPSTDLKRE